MAQASDRTALTGAVRACVAAPAVCGNYAPAWGHTDAQGVTSIQDFDLDPWEHALSRRFEYLSGYNIAAGALR